MKFCINCGKQIDSNYKYCTYCQAAQPDVHAEEQAATHQETQPFPDMNPAEGPVEPPRPMQKRTKILLSLAAALIVLLVGTHLAVKAYLDPARKLQAMDKAIDEDNQQAFLDQIDFDKKALLDQEGYFSYIKDQEWDQVKEQYSALLEEKDGLSQTIYTESGERLFKLKPKKHFGLYRTYTVAAEPVTMKVETPMSATALTVGDVKKQLDPDKPAELLAYPGSYKLTAEAENMYGSFKQSDDVVLNQEGLSDYAIEFGEETFTFDTDQTDAVLFVNGKSTGKKLKDLEEIGPVPKGNKAAVHAEWNSAGKVLKTADTNLAEAEGHHIVFIFDDSLMAEGPPKETIDPQLAEDTIISFRSDYESALNYRDYSYISDYLLTGSPAEKELKKYIGDLKDTDFNYSFQSNDVEKVEEVNAYTVKLTTREQFVFTNHRGEMTDYNRLKVYTVKIAGDSYKISDIQYVKTNRDNN